MHRTFDILPLEWPCFSCFSIWIEQGQVVFSKQRKKNKKVLPLTAIDKFPILDLQDQVANQEMFGGGGGGTNHFEHDNNELQKLLLSKLWATLFWCLQIRNLPCEVLLSFSWFAARNNFNKAMSAISVSGLLWNAALRWSGNIVNFLAKFNKFYLFSRSRYTSAFPVADQDSDG